MSNWAWKFLHKYNIKMTPKLLMKLENFCIDKNYSLFKENRVSKSYKGAKWWKLSFLRQLLCLCHLHIPCCMGSARPCWNGFEFDPLTYTGRRPSWPRDGEIARRMIPVKIASFMVVTDVFWNLVQMYVNKYLIVNVLHN